MAGMPPGARHMENQSHHEALAEPSHDHSHHTRCKQARSLAALPQVTCSWRLINLLAPSFCAGYWGGVHSSLLTVFATGHYPKTGSGQSTIMSPMIIKEWAQRIMDSNNYPSANHLPGKMTTGLRRTCFLDNSSQPCGSHLQVSVDSLSHEAHVCSERRAKACAQKGGWDQTHWLGLITPGAMLVRRTGADG